MRDTVAADTTCIQSLAVSGFRNLRDTRLAIPAPGVVLTGRNGQGKTNFLESLYYFHLLRSFRGAADADLVTFGADGFHLAVTASGTPRGAQDMNVGFDRNARRKKVLVNGAQPPRMSEAYGAVPSVMCSPEDREIVAGAPSARRRYLDVMLSTVSPKYLFALQQYRTALLQRNAAMRSIGRTRGDAVAAVTVWEPALAAHGAQIINARSAWAAGAATEFTGLCAAIGESAPANLHYASRMAGDDTRETLASRLEETRDADVRRGATQAGPHREELRLELDSRELRDFGSAGQQRTAALALRMLEAATMRRVLHTDPVLLLDDPFAELDRERASRILGLLRDIDPGQTILCVPRPDDVPPELSQLPQWSMVAGEIAT